VSGDDALWTVALSLGAGVCIGGLLGVLAAAAVGVPDGNRRCASRWKPCGATQDG